MEDEDKTKAQFLRELTSLSNLLERRTAELANADERLKEHAALLELAHDAVIVRDLHGRVKYWSRRAEEIYGWKRSEAEGRIIHELLKTEFPIALEDLESMGLREGIWKGELIQTTRQNISIVVDSQWTLQRDGNGDPLAMIEINHNITDRKVTESSLRKAVDQLQVRLQERTEDLAAANHALAESEERYRILVESALDIMYCISSDGKIEDLNPAFEVVTGWSASDWIGKSLEPLIHPDDLSNIEDRRRKLLGGGMLPLQKRVF